MKQAFEKYPKLAKLMQEYASFGNFNDWQEFTNELNRVLTFEDDWMPVEKEYPPHNLGVLVFIPEEDSHITAGMWDISKKWVLLDEYREPENEVTHWRILPEPPKIITNDNR